MLVYIHMLVYRNMLCICVCIYMYHSELVVSKECSQASIIDANDIIWTKNSCIKPNNKDCPNLRLTTVLTSFTTKCFPKALTNQTTCTEFGTASAAKKSS